MKINYFSMPLLLNPVVAIFINILGVMFRRKVSYISISLSLILIYSYLPILWDVRNNFFHINFSSSLGLNLYQSGIDIFLTKINLNFITCIVLMASIPSLFFSIYLAPEIERARTLNDKSFFGLVALFLFLFEYRQVMDLQKTYLSVTLVLMALSVKRSIVAWPLALLSATVHPLMGLLSSIYIINSGIKFPKSLIIIASCLSIFVGLFFGNYILQLLATSVSGFLPRAELYTLIETSRFSSPSVALSVKSLRALSLIVFLFVFLRQLSFYNDSWSRQRIKFTIFACLAGVIVSFNEIAFERYYMAAAMTVSFFAIRLRFRGWHLWLIVFAVAANTTMHGFYTLIVIFSQEYELYQDAEQKVIIASRLLYMPTPFLLNYSLFGPSDLTLINVLR